ncbi:hypothetical protein LOD99_12599 [Oopsacas minuta]|uniref:MIF4G domain-containing protein n=1 Tax=Oopsacas minuta TaxID=111878 RepID=A0AAV7JCR5_9METZ|nr:hypothetical protein LOD99_12599 [Oopsacas minuta]
MTENGESEFLDENVLKAKECLDEAIYKYDAKKDFLYSNLNAKNTRPDPESFKQLDSTLKKNTSFVKKLRTITESVKESLATEFEGLNLSKYLQEAANAIAEAKTKSNDIGSVVYICSLFHMRYGEYSGLLYSELAKLYSPAISKDDDKQQLLVKYRLGLRIVGEITLAGIFPANLGINLLGTILKNITIADKFVQGFLPVIVSFTKHLGEDIAGIAPKKYILYSQRYNLDFPKSELIPAESQAEILTLLRDYFVSQKIRLDFLHKEIRQMGAKNKHALQMKGEISEDKREEFEKSQKNFDKISQFLTGLADLLDEEMPSFPDQQNTEEGTNSGFEVFCGLTTMGGSTDSSNLWMDEDARSFYESLPDLKASMPGILFDSNSRTTELPLPENISANEEDPAKLLQEIRESEDTDDSILEGKSEEDDPPTSPSEQTIGSIPTSVTTFDGFLSNLSNCINRQLIDTAATQFITNFNNKGNRKKLLSTLLRVPRNRLDLLSFYARLVGILAPCVPDIGPDIVHSLEREFYHHVRKKDQINIESKIKNVRFIGELTKFRICKKAQALKCLSILTHDFSYHHIEMACSLLENCGRFLYNSPDSQPRTKVLLDIMLRHKSSLHLDAHYDNMIENAFYYTVPSEQSKRVEKDICPLFLYIEKILYKDMNKLNKDKVLKQMRKLNWKDENVFEFAVRALSRSWKVKYNNVLWLADLIGGLVAYQEEVGIRVVDNVLEEIRLGMEVNDPTMNQQRLSTVKFLGELYNYNLVEASVIFRTLYMFLNFGFTSSPENPSSLDPNDNYFRIRIICTLLETCGQYFDHGSSRKKLDNFFIFFQCYVWMKKRPLPILIEFSVTDMMESLRPDIFYYESYEEAQKAALELESQFDKTLRFLTSSSDASVQPTNGVTNVSNKQSLSDEEDDEYYRTSNKSKEKPGTEELQDELDSDEDTSPSDNQEDYQDDVVLSGGIKHITCLEDDEFINALDKAMSDDIQGRRSDATKIPVADIAIPMKLKGSNFKPGGDTEHKEEEHLTFTLMMKKGHKSQYKELKIPATDTLAASIKQQRQAEKTEHEKMKEMILSYEKRRNEEDYQAMQQAEMEKERQQQKRQRGKRFNSQEGYRIKNQSRFKGDLQ